MKYNKENDVKIVECNIEQAKQLLISVGMINKGISVHDINIKAHKIRCYLKNSNIKNIDSIAFKEMCKIKQSLASDVFFATNKL